MKWTEKKKKSQKKNNPIQKKVQASFCVMGGNSPSSSKRIALTGGGSVARSISWNFSDSEIVKNKQAIK